MAGYTVYLPSVESARAACVLYRKMSEEQDKHSLLSLEINVYFKLLDKFNILSLQLNLGNEFLQSNIFVIVLN